MDLRNTRFYRGIGVLAGLGFVLIFSIDDHGVGAARYIFVGFGALGMANNIWKYRELMDK